MFSVVATVNHRAFKKASGPEWLSNLLLCGGARAHQCCLAVRDQAEYGARGTMGKRVITAGRSDSLARGRRRLSFLLSGVVRCGYGSISCGRDRLGTSINTCTF